MLYYRLNIPQIRRQFSLSSTLRSVKPAAEKCYGQELLLTFRERLGRASGKPYIYARWTLAGASALSVAALGFCGLAMTSRANNGVGGGAGAGSVSWPAHVRQHMRTTYAYFAGSFAITGTVAYCVSRLPCISRIRLNGSTLLNWCATLMVATIWISVEMLTDFDDDSTAASPTAKHLAFWVAQLGLIGLLLAPLCHGRGSHAMKVASYIAGMSGALSVTTMCAPSETFLNIAGPLAMGLGVLFAASIFPFNALILQKLSSELFFIFLFACAHFFCIKMAIESAESHPIADSSDDRIRLYRSSYDPIRVQSLIGLPLANIFLFMMRP